MNAFEAVAIIVALFALRFIVPLALSLGVCRGMCWFAERFQA